MIATKSQTLTIILAVISISLLVGSLFLIPDIVFALYSLAGIGHNPVNPLAIILPTLSLVFAYATQVASENRRTAIAREEVKEIRENAQESPEKIKPVWDEARVVMQSYFERNLAQLRSIYWLSLITMLMGFALIVAGVILAFQTPDNSLPVIVSGVAGVLTEFIGGTFLFIYRSTVEQASKHLLTLEKINSVGMAIQILDAAITEDSQTAKDRLLDARIEVAKQLLIGSRESNNS